MCDINVILIDNLMKFGINNQHQLLKQRDDETKEVTQGSNLKVENLHVCSQLDIHVKEFGEFKTVHWH